MGRATDRPAHIYPDNPAYARSRVMTDTTCVQV